MKSKCNRCGQKNKAPYFIFYEVDQQDGKHRFGIFCTECTIELIDQLRGKLEWFHIKETWRAYIQPKARSELEKAGFIHPKYNTQYIEIKRTLKNLT